MQYAANHTMRNHPLMARGNDTNLTTTPSQGTCFVFSKSHPPNKHNTMLSARSSPGVKPGAEINQCWTLAAAQDVEWVPLQAGEFGGLGANQVGADLDLPQETVETVLSYLQVLPPPCGTASPCG